MYFTQAEQFLYSLSNLPRREYMTDASGCDVYLKRLQFFLDILGNPEKQIPHYIHVTGTSGKGSTVHYIHSILKAAGKQVASTTSPHPTLITERWRVGNTVMSKAEFVAIIEQLQPALDTYIRTSPYDMLSFFDLTTAIAFVYFAKKQVEWAAVEVGCGGMYDSTNVIPYKDVAIITNVGLDHMDLLGKTKSSIAVRKAGIITGPCTVITAEQSPNIRKIIVKKAQEFDTTAVAITPKDISDVSFSLAGTTFFYQGNKYTTSAIGEHQSMNASVAIEAARAVGIAEHAITKGIVQARQPLRMEVLSTSPLIIVDGAHNVDKIASTVAAVEQYKKKAKQQGSIHIINGFSGDKQLDEMIANLASLFPTSVALTRNTINHFRKVASPTDLLHIWNEKSPTATIEQFLDPKAALTWSKKQMKKHDILLITGSIFLSSEIRSLLTHASSE